MPSEITSSNHSRYARRDRNISLWKDVKPEWPRRLLHIPSMSSVERQDGDKYGPDNIIQPEYSILTYTWGRWESPGGPHIPVSGTTWAIPAVDEAKFTVKNFEDVINRMGLDYDFAWIDVVCIDQENYDVKMNEIGRQIGIFANASQVYVWLWSLSYARLQDIYDDVTRYGASLDDPEGPFLLKPRMASSSALYDDIAPRQESSQIPQAMLSSLEASIKVLLGDPWFSSLWTLQEGVLRQDAIFLSQDAKPIQHRVDTLNPEADMAQLAMALSAIRSALESYDSGSMEPSYSNLVDSVVKSIKRGGYPANALVNNPNLQWAAAQNREATNAEDRVYGIMALYNIRVGDAVPNNTTPKKPSLSELETEFAIALNTVSPLLGQMFVHAGPRHPYGKTWEISRNIVVPFDFGYWNNQQYSDYCSIKGSTTGPAKIEGLAYRLKDLKHFWVACSTAIGGHPCYFDVALDEYIVKEHPAIIPAPADLKRRRAECFKALFTLIDTTLKEFGEDSISVFKLGGWKWSVFGLILLHLPGNRNEVKRIGICEWQQEGVTTTPDRLEAVQYTGILN
ncbi:hypothetical protein PG993_015115 [Apiospora rasikravindrae]|uniref:Heterokaryon incompatibility domain-containing protein n=1 Tax=Apiospora rasikravindrae TaxID=990691 RepID=A0ABR1RQT8_9PEZI